MGKKSRLKKESKEVFSANQSRQEINGENKPFLYHFIMGIACLSLFTPLFLDKNFYFPFVGPKSLLFMLGCQLVFFAWLFLALWRKEYRPKINSVILAFAIFVLILTISSILGVDPVRSFWSKFERMTGLVFWLHIFAFCLAISSTFKKVSDWKKIFTVSVFAAIIMSFMAIMEFGGVKSFKFSDRGGSTLGNTSFLGTYLLFNVFLAIWLFLQSRKKGRKIFYLASFFLMFIAVYLSEAKAATISIFGGLGIIILLWFSFRPQNRKIKIVSRTVFAALVFVILIGLILLLIPGTFIQNEFIQITGKARVVNWEMASKAFLDKPFFGWGPENYDLAFNKFFNPCFFLEECGTEIWFDRAHNIIFDNLVTVGAIGLIAYLGIFISIFFFLAKKYFKEKNIDFWTFSIFPAMLSAYFIQNLTVFDMASSLMMFSLIIGFLASLGKEKDEPVYVGSASVKNMATKGTVILLIFIIAFLKFFMQPWQADSNVIKALRFQEATEKRIEAYKKVINGSSMGKYQSVEFLAERFQTAAKSQLEEIMKDSARIELAKKEMDVLVSGVEESVKNSPLDFRNVLRLAHLYNLYYFLDSEKIRIAEKYGEEAIKLSPQNQQGYWVLGQTKALEKDFESSIALLEKAIELEPRLFLSYQIAIQITQFFERIDKAEELAQKAISVNPDWEVNFRSVE